MGEAITLAAAVVSSVAAAVGTMISVAEYRRSPDRERGTTAAPPPSSRPATTVPPSVRTRGAPRSTAERANPPPSDAGTVEPEPARRERTIRRAVVVVTIGCLLAAICQVAYWTQFDRYSYQANEDPLVVVTGYGSLVASAIGVVYAVRVAVGGVRGHRWRELRIAGLVFIGAMVPWAVAVLQTVIDARFRGA